MDGEDYMIKQPGTINKKDDLWFRRERVWSFWLLSEECYKGIFEYVEEE